jgi:4-amino-4-deoxy-L-arabinose transferase-like glycosyltransferase
MVKPWLPWAWVACLAVSLFALLPIARPQIQFDRSDRWLLGVVALAVLLRLIALETIPGGFHVDEWGDADFALRYVVPPIEETISPFVTGHSAQPALYFYVARASLAVFGERIAGLRMSSVLAGSLAVVATFALVSLLHSRKAAYLSAVLMATYHFHIHWSRIGLNNIWDTLWVPLILALFVWGWRRKRPAGAALAGLALGLSQYFYAGSRIGIFLLGYLVIRMWRADRDDARLVTHLGRVVGMAAVVAGPLAVFAAVNPEIFFNRLTSGLLWDPFATELARTAPGYLPSVLQQFVWTLLSFTAIPEGAGFYRPGVPLVIGLAVPLLLAGVFWQIHRKELLPVFWLALTMFFGGFLLEALPASNHYAVAIPAICWLIASPLEALIHFGRPRWALLALAIIAATDLYFYFGIYAQAPSLDFIHVFPPNPWN